jgi:hypothetical protein
MGGQMRTGQMRTNAIALIAVAALVGAACSALSAPGTAPREGSTEPDSGASRTFALGGFPKFPQTALPEETAAALQEVLNEAVEDGTFRGVTAAVIVANRGSWTGADGPRTGSP